MNDIVTVTPTAGTKEWALTRLPQFTGLKALVLPGAFYSAAVKLVAEAGFGRANTVEEADVVVFIGGGDINPALYSDRCLKNTHYYQSRDDDEVAVYYKAQGLGKILFGICRGAQLLHAMNGGKLWQDVDGHGGVDHKIYDIEEDVTVVANSFHHQMLMDHDDLTVVAVCSEQNGHRFLADNVIHTINRDDEADIEIEIEAGMYEKTRCFFVQGHPEVGNAWYRSWCMTKLHDCVQEWLPEGIKGLPQVDNAFLTTQIGSIDVVG